MRPRPIPLRARARTLALLLALCASASVADASVEFAFRQEYTRFQNDWARALDWGWGGEFAVFGHDGKWKPGVAVYLGSHDMPRPHSDATWSHLTVFATLRYENLRWGRWMPFAESRVGWIRLRPESTIFLDDPNAPLEAGENPFDPSNGLELGLVAGTAIDLFGGVALELAGSYGAAWTEAADLSPIGASAASNGQLWGLRFGIAWNR